MKLPSIPARLSLPSLLLLALLLPAGAVQADLNSDLAFSAFSNVDVNALAGGQVLQSRGGLIEFQRGITTQSLYVIRAAPAQVQAKLTSWDPATHGELKVWLHQSLPARPTVTDFGGLQTLPDNSSVNFLVDATEKLDPNSPALQVDANEAQLIASLRAQNPEPRALFANAWSQILLGRIDRFLSGRPATDLYLVSGGDIRPVDEIKSLLRSDVKVYQHFHPVLAGTPLYASTRSVPANLYYESFDVEGGAALGTGAIYQAAYGSHSAGNRALPVDLSGMNPAPAPSAEAPIVSADIEYFVNDGIYVSVELEELIPVDLNGQAGTLVWRDDLVSTSNVAYLHGTERLASGMIMLQDVKQAIDAFRSEFR
jgi:hypothetical protein